MAKKDKTKTSKPDVKPAVSLEALSDEQMQALTYQNMNTYQNALAAKKKADADFKNVCKIIKAELGPDGVANIKDLIALDTEEGEKRIRAEVERKMRVARWAGAAIGTQADMFDGVDRTPAIDKARAAGKREGLKGAPRKPPHDPSTPQYAKWIEGYDEGQTATQQAFAAKMQGVNAAKEADKKPTLAETLREQNDAENKKIGEAAREIAARKIGTAEPTTKIVQ